MSRAKDEAADYRMTYSQSIPAKVCVCGMWGSVYRQAGKRTQKLSVGQIIFTYTGTSIYMTVTCKTIFIVTGMTSVHCSTVSFYFCLSPYAALDEPSVKLHACVHTVQCSATIWLQSHDGLLRT